MISHESTEMYMETLYILQKEHGHAHVADIAGYLNVTMPSVSKAMDKLKELKLINKEAYGPITLTAKGERFSRRIKQKHNLISAYLERSLNITHEEADENACRIEHVITDAVLEAIEKYLEDPADQAGGECTSS